MSALLVLRPLAPEKPAWPGFRDDLSVAAEADDGVLCSAEADLQDLLPDPVLAGAWRLVVLPEVEEPDFPRWFDPPGWFWSDFPSR